MPLNETRFSIWCEGIYDLWVTLVRSGEVSMSGKVWKIPTVPSDPTFFFLKYCVEAKLIFLWSPFPLHELEASGMKWFQFYVHNSVVT